MAKNITKLAVFQISLLAIICHAAPRQGPPPVSVETQKLKAQKFQKQLVLVGSVSSEKGVVLKSETSGLITQLPVKSGQYVKQGQLILQTNPKVLQGQLDAALSALELAKNNSSRSKELFHNKVISPQNLDSSTNALNTAKANVKTLRAQLEQTRITAPFSGKLGILKVQFGDYITMGSAVANLQQDKNLWVDFTVPQNQIVQIQQHHKIFVYRQNSQHFYPATWVASESLVDPKTRKLQVRVRVDNTQQTFLPGEFVLVRVDVGSPQTVLKVPQYAVEYSPEGTFIYKLINKKAVKTKVALGPRQDSWVIVKHGLKAADTIITAGRHKLYPNAVLIINPNKKT